MGEVMVGGAVALPSGCGSNCGGTRFEFQAAKTNGKP
jgi:hypothetical protein